MKKVIAAILAITAAAGIINTRTVDAAEIELAPPPMPELIEELPAPPMPPLTVEDIELPPPAMPPIPVESKPEKTKEPEIDYSDDPQLYRNPLDFMDIVEYYPQKGDGWYRIANRLKVSMTDLLMANHATLETPVILGKAIYVPDMGCGVQSHAEPVMIAERTLFNDPNSVSWLNILKSAAALDGMELKAGETFRWWSYPAFKSGCGKSAGYVKSTVLVNGERQEGYGGGICFTSTTLWQTAVLSCGMQSVTRCSHSANVSYCHTGVDDAAVNAYNKDMAFKNTTGHDVRFEVRADGLTGGLTVKVYEIN